MKTIKPLPEGVRHSMRSGIIMFDMTRVVEELVFNSLDAGATKVSIFFGVATCFVKVVDDGSGVSRDDLVLFGERYATSKFHDVTNMETARESFGFRGEALASISDISLLEITTKAIGKPNGYRKVMKGSKCLHLGIDDDRKDSGTTVTVRDLFYNQPVRQKYMQSSPKKVLDSIKKCMMQIALVHSYVSFNVLDIESDEGIFQTNPSSSAFSLLMRDSGTEVVNSLRKVSVRDGLLSVSGYVSIPGESFKAFQYLYINSRFVSKGPIHKLLNNLAASIECTDDWKPRDGIETGRRNSPQSNPAYILCITCPRHFYEFSFEPSKTHVEFKNWDPVLAFIGKTILANWKKDTRLGIYDLGADLPKEGNRHGLIDDMIRLQDDDWAVDMEPTKKKPRRNNYQAPCSLLLSQSADRKRKGDYFSQRKDAWFPQYEFEVESDKLKEQDTVGNFDRQTDFPLQSCENNEAFPHVTDLVETSLVAPVKHTKQSLKRYRISKPLKVDHEFWKDPDDSSFWFEESKDDLDVSNCIGKHLLRGCSSRGNLTLNEPILSHSKWSESPMPVIPHDKRSNFLIRGLETKEGSSCGVSSGTLESYGVTKTSDCPLGSPWPDTDWFIPQSSPDSGNGGIGEYFNITPIVTKQFSSYEDNFFRKKYISSLNVGNSGAGSFYSNSVWSPVLFESPSKIKWNSDYKNRSQIPGGNWRLETTPDHEYFSSGANSNKFDLEVIRQIDYRDSGSISCKDSITDIRNWIQSDETFCKSSWGHVNNVGIEQYSIREDKFINRDDTKSNFGTRSLRRSHSAPPFYREKKRFVSLSSKADAHSKNFDPSFSHYSSSSRAPGDLECLTLPSSASPIHLKGSILDDVSYDHKQKPEKRLSSASDVKASADCKIMHSGTQDDTGDKDFSSQEILEPSNSTVKWRYNCLESQAAKESHKLKDQEDVLDICSGFPHHLSDESLVPESIKRDSLEDAKVLQQVDKKYIPIIAGGIIAIIDQHAADERIRLEELRQKVLAGEERTVTYLNAEQELLLPEMGYQLLQSYSEQIRDWGWICNINVQGSTSFKKNMSIIQQKPTPITLNAVPCILGVNLSVADLLEFLQQLVDTDGSSTIPPSVLRILNSKACRGAIMFGDSLLPSECSLIIEELKQTSLCFQCAHGRPTTVPLVNLKALHKQIAKLESIHLWHGLKRREITLDHAKARLEAAKS